MPFKLSSSGRGMVPRDKAHMPQAAMDVFLDALADPSPKVVVKSLLHVAPEYLEKTDEDFRRRYLSALRARIKGTNPRVQAYALLTLWKILPVEQVRSEFPDYESRLAEISKSDERLLRINAGRVGARLENRKYPLLLQMAEGTPEEYKETCDREGTGLHSRCYYYGELLEYQGKPELAREYYRKDCDTSGNYMGPGCEKLGDEALARGDTESARKYYEGISQVYGTDSNSLVKLAELALAEKDQNTACQWFLLSCYWGNDAACEQGEFCDAHEDVQSARKRKKSRTPNADVGALNKAHSLAQDERYDQAISLLEKPSSLGNAFAAAQLAEIYKAQGRLEKAEAILSAGCKQLEGLACLRLGSLLEERGESEKALHAYKRGCYVDRIECLKRLADFYARQGNAERARRQYDYLCRVTEGSYSAEYCRMAKAPKPSAELPALEKKCLDGDAASCKKAGGMLEERFEFEKALSLYKSSCSNGASFASCRSYTLLLRRLGRWDEYDAFVDSRCPGDAEACMLLAARKKQAGKPAEARNIYLELCVKEHSGSACRKLRQLAKSSMDEPQQLAMFTEACESGGEPSSCAAAALLHAKAGDTALRDSLLEKAQALLQRRCRGTRTECAEAAIMSCALGKKDEGKKALEALCRERSKYCKGIEQCENALQLLAEELL